MLTIHTPRCKKIQNDLILESSFTCYDFPMCYSMLFFESVKANVLWYQSQNTTWKRKKINIILIQFIINILLEISVTIQSIPSSNPSPVNAEQAMIPQCLVWIKSNSKYSLIYCNVNDFGTSYLLQNINNVAPISFSYFNRLCNSFLQSSNLALSVESTTQINPSVYSK